MSVRGKVKNNITDAVLQYKPSVCMHRQKEGGLELQCYFHYLAFLNFPLQLLLLLVFSNPDTYLMIILEGN